ncbi:MAG TPA: ABC transporter substrate-binding protein [Bosea sp. (in: a-proteobacteria)]|uniref:ABC transporter substrate-binding protein n=1 Tax=Bosea sp. (in: a-proteobacteria) TaxID=1871050 RepID=UPI002E156ECE|nr:ABC transporter substrate-binding protein [Bosea sp. (in: a-proteobacteria)]
MGFLGLATEPADRPLIAALRRGLQERGHVEGRTILLESRHAAGDLGLAGRFIDEMALRPVDVFVAPGPAAARAIHRATQIPIVALGLPPVPSDQGLFASLAKPGGRVTGFSYFGEALSAKRIEALREILPRSSMLGILHNVADPVFREWGGQTEAAARAQGFEALRLGLRSALPGDVAEHLRNLKSRGGDAVIVITDFLTVSLKDEIIRNCAELKVAVISEWPTFVEAGALMFYGADIPELFRQAAGYVDRIVRGERAGDLPIQLATKFRMVINLKTARALDIAVPPSLLASADEVLE